MMRCARILYVCIALPRARQVYMYNETRVTRRMNFLRIFACAVIKKKTTPASLMDFKGGPPVINGQTISAGVLQRV